MKKICWLKTAKTGGTSLRHMFCNQIYNITEDYLLKKYLPIEDYDITDREFFFMPHSLWTEYHYKQNKEIFDDSIIICSIRNPIDRFLSGCKHFKLDPSKVIDNMPTRTVQDPLDWDPTVRRNKVWVHVGQTIHEFLLNGKIKPHYWIRQENLLDDLQSFCDKVKGCDKRFDLKLRNVRKNMSRKKKYEISEETKRKMLKFFNKDFGYFNQVEHINNNFQIDKLIV